MEQYEDEIMEIAIYFLSILALPENDIADYLSDIEANGSLVIEMEDYCGEDNRNSPCLPFKLFCWVPLYSPSMLGFSDLPYFESLSHKDQELCENQVSRLSDYLDAIAWAGELIEYDVAYPSGDGFQKKMQTFKSIQLEGVDNQDFVDHNDIKKHLLDTDFKPFSKQSFYNERCWSRVREESRGVLKALGFSPQMPGETIQEISRQLMP